MNPVERFEMKFFADDPLDCALWAVMETLIQRRRAAHTIKDALARTLLGNEQPVQMAAPPQIMNGRAFDVIPAPDGQADNTAADNFLNMFG